MGKFIVVLSSRLLEEIQQNLLDGLVDYSKRFKQACADGSLEFHIFKEHFDRYILYNDAMRGHTICAYYFHFHKLLSGKSNITQETILSALSTYPHMPPIKIIEKNNGISNSKEK